MSRVDVTHVFTGRVIEVNIERVELPNGTTASLEIIRHPGGAAVLDYTLEWSPSSTSRR